MYNTSTSIGDAKENPKGKSMSTVWANCTKCVSTPFVMARVKYGRTVDTGTEIGVGNTLLFCYHELTSALWVRVGPHTRLCTGTSVLSDENVSIITTDVGHRGVGSGGECH